MKLLRRAKDKISGPPEGAHGQRNIDGSYFTIWMRPCGHPEIGDAEQAPEDRLTCTKCMFDRMTSRQPAAEHDGEWRRATPEEARAFIFEIEGFSMDNGVGFKMLV